MSIYIFLEAMSKTKSSINIKALINLFCSSMIKFVYKIVLNIKRHWENIYLKLKSSIIIIYLLLYVIYIYVIYLITRNISEITLFNEST